MAYLSHSSSIQQEALTALQRPTRQPNVCQQTQQHRFTNNLMVRVGLCLLAAVHVLLGSSCTTAPLQLGMDTSIDDDIRLAYRIFDREIQMEDDSYCIERRNMMRVPYEKDLSRISTSPGATPVDVSSSVIASFKNVTLTKLRQDLNWYREEGQLSLDEIDPVYHPHLLQLDLDIRLTAPLHASTKKIKLAIMERDRYYYLYRAETKIKAAQAKQKEEQEKVAQAKQKEEQEKAAQAKQKEEQEKAALTTDYEIIDVPHRTRGASTSA